MYKACDLPRPNRTHSLIARGHVNLCWYASSRFRMQFSKFPYRFLFVVYSNCCSVVKLKYIFCLAARSKNLPTRAFLLHWLYCVKLITWPCLSYFGSFMRRPSGAMTVPLPTAFLPVIASTSLSWSYSLSRVSLGLTGELSDGSARICFRCQSVYCHCCPCCPFAPWCHVASPSLAPAFIPA